MALRKKKTRNSSARNCQAVLKYETLESKAMLAADLGSKILGIMPPPPENWDQRAIFGYGSRGPGIASVDETFKLHSRPSATKTIYLDFDGFTASGTSWNSSKGRDPIISPPYSADSDPTFSDKELNDIQTIWQRVSGDFAPFDVNVTTEDPGTEALVNTGGSDNRWGIRVVFTTDNFPAPGSGGVAYIGSFRWGYETAGATDTPCYVFNIQPPYAALAASHEVGHSLGLSHDGTNGNNPLQPNASYYSGHGGSDENSWGTVMGAPYTRNVTQWDNGYYIGSNNGGSNANYGSGPDDISIITGAANGFGFNPDEQGGTRDTAAELTGSTDANFRKTISLLGTIERANDQDFFRFEAAAGLLDLTFDPYVTKVYTRIQDGSFTISNRNALFDSGNWPYTQSANLDIEATLYDASGAVIATSNPNGLRAEFKSLTLSGGIYYLRIDGVGFGDPKANPPTGYTDYGSIGQYLITGSFPSTNSAPTLDPLDDLTIDEDAPQQTVNLSGISAGSGENQPLRVFASSGNTSLIPTPAVNYVSPDTTGSLTFKPATNQSGTATITVTVEDGGTDNNLSTTSDNQTVFRTFIVTVNPLNDAPTITNLGGDITYRENVIVARLCNNVRVQDIDTPVFNNGTLRLTLVAGGESADRLWFTNSQYLTVNGNQLLFNGLVVGTFTGGTSNQPLLVTFNNRATINRVQHVLRCACFAHDSENPQASQRVVSIELNDGAGAQTNATKRVNVIPANDRPSLTGIPTSSNYTLNSPIIRIAPAAVLTDPDSPDFGGGVLRLRFTSGADSANRLLLGGLFTVDSANNVLRNGIIIGTRNAGGGIGTTELQVFFNSNATREIVQDLLRGLSFRTINGTQKNSRTLDISLGDGDGGTIFVQTRIDVV